MLLSLPPVPAYVPGRACPSNIAPSPACRCCATPSSGCRRMAAFDGITVVINPADRALYDAAVAGLGLPEPVAGGATRQQSVRAGLEALAADPPSIWSWCMMRRGRWCRIALLDALLAALADPAHDGAVPGLAGQSTACAAAARTTKPRSIATDCGACRRRRPSALPRCSPRTAPQRPAPPMNWPSPWPPGCKSR